MVRVLLLEVLALVENEVKGAVSVRPPVAHQPGDEGVLHGGDDVGVDPRTAFEEDLGRERPTSEMAEPEVNMSGPGAVPS